MKRTKENTYLWQLLATLLLLATHSLFSACSSDDMNATPATTPDSEIRFNPSVWQVMEGTRTTTYDNATALQNEGSFTCEVYEANSLTPYINQIQVDWDNSNWVFSDGKHYWPATGSLDFFAYMPKSDNLPSYITNITYAVNANPAPEPYFICANLPMTYTSAYTDDKSVSHSAEGQTSDLKEFIYAMAMGQNKAGTGTNQPAAGQVALTFQHPFARIKFQLSASHPDITINSITFKSLKTGGTCSFNGSTSTWSSLTPSDKTVDFVMTLKEAESLFNDNTATKQIGPTFLMIPQTFGGEIVVNATWTDWGSQLAHNVSTTLPSVTNWQAGYSYTYTFTITETDLIVDTSKFTEQW
jgi:hypothetical protein